MCTISNVPTCCWKFFAYLTFKDALSLRLASTLLLEGWEEWKKVAMQSVDEFNPSRTMINVRQCMVCGACRADNRIWHYHVPWTVPPQSVFVYCNDSYCVYHTVRNIARLGGYNGNRMILNKILPRGIVVPRSSGKMQKASWSPGFVHMKAGRPYVHVQWWGEDGYQYGKMVPFDDPSIQAQKLAEPRYFRYM